jgi:hypothetical protein
VEQVKQQQPPWHLLSRGSCVLGMHGYIPGAVIDRMLLGLHFTTLGTSLQRVMPAWLISASCVILGVTLFICLACGYWVFQVGSGMMLAW